MKKTNDQEQAQEKKRLPKYKRVSKKEAPRLVLQERDLEILKTVWDYRYLQSHHIIALIKGTRRKLYERLRKLYHHHYLDRLFFPLQLYSGGSEKTIHVLDKRGADLLVEKLGISREKIRWSNSIKSVEERNLRHSLMIANFRVILTLAVRNNPDLELLLWKQGNELRDSVSEVDENGVNVRYPVVPDAYFGVKDTRKPEGRQVAYYFLEADRSTMTNDRYLKKMRGYWIYWREKKYKEKYKIHSFRVLTLTMTEKREDNLVRTTKKADDNKKGSLLFLFTHEGLISIEKPESVLDPIWRTPVDGERKHGLLE